jgi:hypothetical protein
MKLFFAGVGLFVSAFILGFYIHSTNQSLGLIDVPFTTVTVGSATTATDTATALIEQNSARSYLLVINDSTSTIYLWPSATSTGALQNAGLRLATGESYEFRDVNLYQGKLWLATSTVASKILYIER